MERKRPQVQLNREGFAMATTLLVILVLSVVAVAAAWLASTEKRTSFAESVHVSAVFSADAGGEAAINFLRLTDKPPMIVDPADSTVRNQGTTAIHEDQEFEFACRWKERRAKPGWEFEYIDYDYDVEATGTYTADGRTAVGLVASRLFREGY